LGQQAAGLPHSDPGFSSGPIQMVETLTRREQAVADREIARQAALPGMPLDSISK